MGLSASQSRFLSLQNRKMSVGLELMTLANRKSALTREMKRISDNYSDTLKDTKFMFSIDCGVNTYEVTYDLLMKPNTLNTLSPYIITDQYGRVVVDDKSIELDGVDLGVSYKDLANIISDNGEPCLSKDSYYNSNNPEEDNLRNRICQHLGILDEEFTGYTKEKIMDYFDAIFRRISEKGWVYDERINDSSNVSESSKYLNSMLQSNQYYITEARVKDEHSRYQFVTKQATSISKLFSIRDEDTINAEYTIYAEKRNEISTKEKQLDKKMTMLETEQEALNTELEQLKKVRDDNLNKYFKIFV